VTCPNSKVSCEEAISPAVLRTKGAAPNVPSKQPFDLAAPLHDGCERPFSPRLLGHREFKARDVYRFVSPKENRPVNVCGPFEFGFRLCLEFDSQVIAVTERPRKLFVGGKPVELSFWWRERSGRERFALLVPDPDTLPGADGKRRPRQLERLMAAACDAGIHLQTIVETELMERSTRVELYYHLLPFVQSARELKSGLVLRQEVLSVISLYPRVRVEQVVQELARFPPARIHIVIAELFYLGAIETDASTRLRNESLIWRTPA
jgi:hypothetical protein